MTTTTKQSLLRKIETREATITVTFDRLSASIGLGYVGLLLAVAFAEAGPLRQAQDVASTSSGRRFRVTGIDIDADRVAAINRGESYVSDVPSEPTRTARRRDQ